MKVIDIAIQILLVIFCAVIIELEFSSVQALLLGLFFVSNMLGIYQIISSLIRWNYTQESEVDFRAKISWFWVGVTAYGAFFLPLIFLTGPLGLLLLLLGSVFLVSYYFYITLTETLQEIELENSGKRII